VIVYGDRKRRADPRALAAAARDFFDAAELVQGLLDAAFEARGRRDDLGPLERAAGPVLVSVASGRPVRDALAPLLAGDLPREVVVGVPEGYAHYAVQPEAYLRAAERARRELGERPYAVIGIRAIGAGLAGMVARALDPEIPPVTVRPVGHPFARTLALGPALEAALVALAPRATFAIVDEGPGLSGSSFGAVADVLEGLGVPLERIVFFPSHANDPGPQASERHRDRWRRARRYIAAFDRAAAGLPDDAEELRLGSRLKLRFRAGDRPMLAKFAGLGRAGEAKLPIAQALAEAGFTPPAGDLRSGFLVGPWLEDARPAQPSLEHVASYLAFRHERFPAATEDGASPAELLAMVRHNGGEDIAAPFEGIVDTLAQSARPVRVDGRLHAPKWIARPDGRIFKVDALDHHCAHDIVGCQDLAWDVAGAAVELDVHATALAAAIARRCSWGEPHPAALTFYRAAYLAFQRGLSTYAGDSAAANRYAVLLGGAGKAFA
jgi:hypothetical protein